MMKHILSIALLLTATAYSQQNSLSDLELKEIVKRLESIRVEQLTVKVNAINEAIRKLEAGAAGGASATNMYEAAIKLTKFAGKRDDAKNFEEWRKKEEANLRAASMQAAIQLHLRYLVLSLKWNGIPDKNTLLPAVRNYVKAMAESERMFRRPPPLNEEGRKLITLPISESPIVALLGISSLLPTEGWEPVPGNIDGILNQTLRPRLREAKSPELIELWNQQIEMEGEKAATMQLELEREKFNTVRRPQLLWQRAQDLVVLGQTKQGYLTMLEIIVANPKHNDYDKWIKELSDALAKQSAPSVKTAPAPAPAAPAEHALPPVAETPAAEAPAPAEQTAPAVADTPVPEAAASESPVSSPAQ